MAAPDAETQQRVASWFASLDPAMQGVLDAIYAEAPEAVSKVISSGTWTADAADPPLSEVLGGGDLSSYTGLFMSDVDVRPWPVTEGATLQVSIPLTYTGSGTHPAFDTIVSWTTPEGGSDTRTINTDAIESGGTAVIDFELVDLKIGEYDLKFDINKEGAPLGAPPNANGTHIEYPMPFFVLSAEGGADEQDDTAWSAARGLLLTLVNDPSRPSELLREAINWLATLELDHGEREVIEAAAGWVDHIAQLESEGAMEPLLDEVTAVGVAASRGGTNDVEGRSPLIEAIDALIKAAAAQ